MNIKNLCRALKNRGNKKIVLINGNFNILHPGHIRFINFAAMCGDLLVVAVNPDCGEGVFVKEETRLNSIKSLKNIDYALIVTGDYLNFVNELKPDIIVKGSEYAALKNIEDEYINNYQAKLIFSSGDAEGSIYHERQFLEQGNYECLDYLSRNQISKNNLIKVINDFEGKNVIVIGDVIVDRYVECDPIGMSQEDPTIVVRPLSEKKFLGGAGIVAHHLANLGANCFFFTVTGNDRLAEFIKECTSSSKIKNKIFYDESRITIHKKRYRVGNKTMLRVNEYRSHDLSIQIADAIYREIEKIISTVDMLIFSDFNYGCLPQYLVDKLTELCNKNKVQIFADSQSSSQTGDSSRFKRATFIALTEREARLALHDSTSGLVVLAEKICKKSNTQYCLLKVGSDGLLIHVQESNKLYKSTDQVPALNNTPVDVAGAGDSMLAAASLAMISGANIWEAAYIGSVMAAIQVARIGNIPITSEELKRELK
jgi:rfaE bifunctional protein kinase chain/domain